MGGSLSVDRELNLRRVHGLAEPSVDPLVLRLVWFRLRGTFLRQAGAVGLDLDLFQVFQRRSVGVQREMDFAGVRRGNDSERC